VERLAEEVLVIVAGRLAASGDFREIRKLMTDRPHTFNVRSSDNRALAAALVANPSVYGVELQDGLLQVRTGEFAHSPRLSRRGTQACVSTTIAPTMSRSRACSSYLVKR